MLEPAVFLAAFAAATVLSAGLTPLSRLIALRIGLVDSPNSRRLNTVPMPTGGGLAIFLSFFLTAGLFGRSPSLAVLAAGSIILLTGLIDDYKELSAGWKFAGQLLAVAIFVAFGPRIEFVSNPWGEMIFLGSFSIPLTVLWVLSLTNIINFIDGLDGLAAGISLIASLALFSIAFGLGRLEAAFLTAVLAGSLIGFLPFNFNPAKIYLGDAGALFLGFMLAAVSTEGALKGAATIGLTIPTLILAVPVMDTFCAVIRRLQRGIPFYQADAQHFHHRMLALGLSQRQVALFAYFLTLGSTAAAFYSLRFNLNPAISGVLVAAAFFWGALRVGLIESPLIRPWTRRMTR